MKASDLQTVIAGVAPVMRELVEAGTKQLADRVGALEQKSPPKDGRDGKDGADGQHGAPGERGPAGEPGQPGPVGPAGDRGEKGDPADAGALMATLRTEMREAAAAERSAFIGELTTAVLSKALAAGFTTDMGRTT